jgi:membrane protein implicated in regulation of membrane protease activity
MEFIDNKIFWFGLSIVMFVLEIFVPGFFLFFFGLGALITSILNLMGFLPTLNLQIISFIGFSLISLVFLRKHFIKIFKGKKDKLNLDTNELDGKTAVCVVNIIPNEPSGKVEINGTLWSAVADVPIMKGSLVEVVKRIDLKLHVRPAGGN